MDHDIDPYIPVAISDCCVGIPFTSPVLVGMSGRRDGIFYDPLGTARGFRPREFETALVNGRDAFIERLAAWCEEKPAPPAEFSLMFNQGDPGERFHSMLRDPSFA